MSESIFEKKLSSLFFNSFIEKLKQTNTINLNDIQTLEKKIDNVIIHCNSNAENLLIIGKVQSGKTRFFLGIISKLFDKDTNIVFVLAGVDKDIYNQNLTRIKENFDSDQINKKIAIFSDKEKNLNEIKKALDENKKIIICLLKNHANINKWNNIIKEFNSLIINPIIIDDEGDQFSFTDIKKEQKTATHQSIINVFNSLEKKYTFISVTATPYAHILVNEEDCIKPDYAFVMDTNPEYVGINFFNESIFDNRNDIVKTIPEKELKEFFESDTLGDTFNEAIIDFFFNGTILYTFLNKEPDMLINPDKKIKSHDDVYNNLVTRIEQFEENLNNEDFKTIQKLKKIYNNFIDSNFYENLNVKFSFDELKNGIKTLISNKSNVSYLVINGNNKIDNSKRSIFNFYIGSNKLSRGITLSHLITSYVFRGTRVKEYTLDTIYQMARWLGYRNEYKYLITVYLPSNLIDNYIRNEEIDNNIIEFILKKAEEKGISLKEIDKELIYNTENTENKRINGTRKTVANTKTINNNVSNEKNIFYNKKWKEYNYEENQDNKDIFESIEAKIGNQKELFSLKNITNKISNYPSTKFKNFEEFENFVGRIKLNKIFSYISFKEKYINLLKNEYKDKEIICSIMTKNNNDTIKNYSPRMRKYDSQKQELNILFQGQSENYIGDIYWQIATENKFIFIQFFKIKIKINDDKNQIIYKNAILLPIISSISIGKKTFSITSIMK